MLYELVVFNSDGSESILNINLYAIDMYELHQNDEDDHRITLYITGGQILRFRITLEEARCFSKVMRTELGRIDKAKYMK